MAKRKTKPAKSKKASGKVRRGAGVRKSKRTVAAPKTRPTPRAGGKKRATGRLRRTEAGPVWIGNAAKPVNLPSDDRGSNKATGSSERVVIL